MPRFLRYTKYGRRFGKEGDGAMLRRKNGRQTALKNTIYYDKMVASGEKWSESVTKW